MVEPNSAVDIQHATPLDAVVADTYTFGELRSGPVVLHRQKRREAHLGENFLASKHNLRNDNEEVDSSATELRSDGPWTIAFGLYGISMKTGRYLWTSHARTFARHFVRMLDFDFLVSQTIFEMPHHVI